MNQLDHSEYPGRHPSVLQNIITLPSLFPKLLNTLFPLQMRETVSEFLSFMLYCLLQSILYKLCNYIPRVVVVAP